jgi:CheY-like chemotaxis protein
MIELRTTFAPQLPPVAMDPSQVHQVIMNLATNAAHAIGRQVGLIEIGLDTVTRAADAGPASSSTAEGRYVRLSLSDNGCGMDAATLERVFDPFFTTKPPGEGTGLGLSLVHGIMLSHGGTVTAYSQPGKGTTFSLHFPVAEAGGVETPEAQAPLPSELPAGRGGRVMIVDDEEDLVELQLLALGRLGYEVVGHTDPARALEAFRARPHDYDVVVTDLSMPSMSGLDLARELLAVRPGLPILISSGYIPPEEQEAARLLGIRGLVTKPDTIGALRDILGRLFETIEVGDV